jgi:fluoroquinolone transport system permease protein
MPSRLLALVIGDWQRFRKYHLLTANLVLLTIWVLATLAMNRQQLTQFIPFILLMDSTVMTMVLIGTTILYEKQEHTIDAILTSPVNGTEYLSAKVTTGILNSLVTMALVTISIWLVTGITVSRWVLLPPAIIVVAGFHAMLGIALTYGAQGFTAIILRSVAYMFAVWLPAVFTLFDLIPHAAFKDLLLLPPVSAARLLAAGFATVPGWQLIFGYLYLLMLGAVLFIGIVRPGFQRYVLREIGV